MKQAGVWIVMAPADRPHAGDQTKPVHEQDENENRREEPKRFSHQFAPDNSFKKVIQSPDQPLPEILNAAWNRLDVLGRDLGKNDDKKQRFRIFLGYSCSPD